MSVRRLVIGLIESDQVVEFWRSSGDEQQALYCLDSW